MHEHDLDEDTATAIDLAVGAHARLVARVEGCTDDQMRAESRLAGWTVGHVLTHLARNADGHVRRLEGALDGIDLARYAGGSAQRDAEIEGGSGRPAAAIVDDLAGAQRALERVWERCVAEGWPHREFFGDDRWPTTASPVRRLREVEMHHVDLGLGYEPSSWPEEYVGWELGAILQTVPRRLARTEDRRRLVAWRSGRGGPPLGLALDPW